MENLKSMKNALNYLDNNYIKCVLIISLTYFLEK